MAELVRRIQTGDQAAIRDLHSKFATGIEFLLRRKLRKSLLSAEVDRVLEAVVHEIQGSSVVNLRRLVARSLNRLFPPNTADSDSGVADPSRERAAHAVLAERQPLEQDILRRYYVLRESTAMIRGRLRVSSETIEKTIANARATFRQKADGIESG